ncbi:MAG TPA: NAD/NADP octopine/nopaline dehydrogenase family protein [Clostridia bacterium]|nr:NAD/NADP octopine/nopaline dehydrogenase family protein [Clostridia bacterium]
MNFAIIGAGAGGQTMAAILADKGYRVKLYDVDQEKIRRLNELKKIKVTGLIECDAAPELITGCLADALEDADVIMVVSTTDAHRSIAEECLPFLRDGQMIVLNPGHCGGALEVANVIRGEGGCGKDVIIAEAGDLMYACRSYEIGTAYQSGIKSATPIATLPGKDISRLKEALGPIFPNLTPVNSVLETSFRGGGAMLHPIPSLMNINKLDAGENYDYYMEGITPSVADIISACDRERVAVCRAIGVNAETLVESLKSIYRLEQNDLYDLLQHNEAYRGLKSPKTVTHRFIVEDTFSGLVPLTSVGKLLGIATPMMDAFVEIASVVCKRDFRTEGRTAEKLGFAGKTLEQIHQMVR